MKKLSILILLLSTIISCKEDENTSIQKGGLEINFENIINEAPIVLNTDSYTNQSDETYAISELKYIISNIVLIKSNGDEFVYPVSDSYFLINEAISDSKKIELNDINADDYTKIKFGFGVDQSNYPLNGVNNFIPTAEENGMLWSWSAGYKFLKLEGSYTPQGGTTSDYLLHIGSHGTILDNYKEITLSLPVSFSIKENKTSNILISADISKIFDSTHTHSLTVKSDVQVDPVNAPKLAENISTMFGLNTSN